MPVSSKFMGVFFRIAIKHSKNVISIFKESKEKKSDVVYNARTRDFDLILVFLHFLYVLDSFRKSIITSKIFPLTTETIIFWWIFFCICRPLITFFFDFDMHQRINFFLFKIVKKNVFYDR